MKEPLKEREEEYLFKSDITSPERLDNKTTQRAKKVQKYSFYITSYKKD
jgi:hypothetical protein